MTQLWMWKYKGHDFVGNKGLGNSCFVGVNELAEIYTIGIGQVTNLHKVKVVDEDAITISRDLWNWIDSSDVAYENGFRIRDKILSENLHLKPPPPVTKTYLTTDQFIKVYKSLSDEKSRELSAANSTARSAARDAANYAAYSVAWSVAWNAANSTARSAARDADLAVLAKDKITAEQFEILTSPWTGCGLSLYAEDWDEVLNPKVTEPNGFAAVVEASSQSGVFISNRFRVVYSGNGVWREENSRRSYKWSDLINPVVISEGQK